VERLTWLGWSLIALAAAITLLALFRWALKDARTQL
jgi:hypothetical protein